MILGVEVGELPQDRAIAIDFKHHRRASIQLESITDGSGHDNLPFGRYAAALLDSHLKAG